MVDQEKPISTPGDIAHDLLIPRYLHRDIFGVPVARHIAYRNATGRVQGSDYFADGRVDAVLSWLDPAEIGEGGHQTDGAVAAHSKIANVVEKNDSGRARRDSRRTKQAANQDIRAARLVDDGGPQPVVSVLQNPAALGNRSAAQFRTAINDNPGRFSPSV